MRKLVFGALLFGSLGMASGCIITTDDDDDDGRFAMTWTLEAGVGNEITCTEAGAGGVASLATLAGTQTGVEDIFTCENAGGTTGILPLGDYTVVVSILDNDDAAIGTSMPRSESLVDPGVDVDLGNFLFDFGAPGDVLFIVDYGAASGSNCAGGAGGETVDDQGTNLVLVGSTSCIAVSLEVAGTVDTQDICSETPLCIESDIQQALLDLDPDVYDLEITGLFDNGGTTVACFRSIDRFEISDGDESFDIPVPFDDAEDPTFCATI